MDKYTIQEEAYKRGYEQGMKELEADNERLRDMWAKAVSDGSKALSQIPRWIPVTKRKPKVGEFVLFMYAKNNHNPTLYAKNTMAVGRYEQRMFLVDGCQVMVTHWMPLPEPPKGE